MKFEKDSGPFTEVTLDFMSNKNQLFRYNLLNLDGGYIF